MGLLALVCEAIVVLSPYSRCEENVERRDLLPPFDLKTFLDPLAMLIDHRVDDVDERLVAIEETVSARKDVAFEPALMHVSFESDMYRL
jgi:hypothetical protein